MRIIFIGTVEFSAKMLSKLIAMNADVVGVVTKEKSGFNADFFDLAPLCKSANIPCRFVEDVNSEDTVCWIKSLNPDVIFCFGWSSLIKNELLNLTEHGVIGFHPARLPLNRGRHPIIWALALGLGETASTFFIMDEGADSGDILSQKIIQISYEDNAKSLYNRVVNAAELQLEQLYHELKCHRFVKVKQDSSKANYWRKRTERDGLINWNMSSNAIYNLVRALTKPYVGAHLLYNHKKTIVLRVEELSCQNMNNIEPGKILEVSDSFVDVKCYDGVIRILKHEFEALPKVGEYL
jgi:methionyl-tRNA formyltransferase